MDNPIDSLTTISIPITVADRQQAVEFAAQQLTSDKATQVYRNTIAVLVCDRYLKMLAIPTGVPQSQSWNPISRCLMNVADLYLPTVKMTLECRSVSLGETHCIIPLEVQESRIGYLVVQLDEPYLEGTILGFASKVLVTELPLKQLQPLEIFMDIFTGIKAAEEHPLVRINLGNWLKGKFEDSWQPCIDLLMPPKHPELMMASFRKTDVESLQKTEALLRSIRQLYQQAALGKESKAILSHDDPATALLHLIQVTQQDEIRWQAAELLWEIDPNHPASPVVSAKDLGLYLNGHAVGLMVGILPKSDHRQLILLRLYPLQAKPCLPKALRLAVFDGTNNSLIELESRAQDQCIQFKFTADQGDLFQARISLDDASVVENFIA